MASRSPPSPPRGDSAFVSRDGRLTNEGMTMLQEMWRQVVAGFVSVPCSASGKNAITLTPLRHKEGAAVYADHEVFIFVAEQTSDGAVTIEVGELGFVKAYKTGGSAQAGAGDVVQDLLYVAIYNSALDTGAGGLVLK